jgi:hypothetical protein
MDFWVMPKEAGVKIEFWLKKKKRQFLEQG